MSPENLTSIEIAEPTERRRIYLQNRPRLVSPIQRFNWARTAAMLGVSEAIRDVIGAYLDGEGTEPNQTQAFEWRLLGASMGDRELFMDLAQAYQDGIGTPQNIDQYWHWMERAAKGGTAEAMFSLADAHQKKNFGKVSAERAEYWIDHMAKLGAPGAMVELATIHLRSDPRDSRKIAIDWARKAERKAQQLLRQAQSEGSLEEARADFVLVDLPKAQLVLAEIYEANRRRTQAERMRCKAANSAESAIRFAIRSNVDFEVELINYLLPNIDKAEDSGNQVEYFRSLLQAKNFIDSFLMFSPDFEGEGSEIGSILYRLAVAYRDGTGTPSRLDIYKDMLEQAIRFGHEEAAREFALTAYNPLDLAAYRKALSQFPTTSSVQTLILSSLGDLALSKQGFRKAWGRLLELWNEVDRIRTERHVVVEADCPGGVAHYTDALALAGMLASADEPKNLIRLYSIDSVNDPQEGMKLLNVEDNKKGALRQVLGETKGFVSIPWKGAEFHVFVGCFTVQEDSLNLWRFGYGRDGRGFSIVTPLSAFERDNHQGMIRSANMSESQKLTLYKVIYDDDRARETLAALTPHLFNILAQSKRLSKEKGSGLLAIAKMIVYEILYLYKDAAYLREEELRAVVARPLGDSRLRQHASSEGFSKLYVEADPFLFREPKSRIILGPKVENAQIVRIDLHHRLAQHGWTGCSVHLSENVYR